MSLVRSFAVLITGLCFIWQGHVSAAVVNAPAVTHGLVMAIDPVDALRLPGPDAQAIPEPPIYVLLGFGLLICSQRFIRRRRKQ